MLNVICVNYNNYAGCGGMYVDRLRNAVEKHLPWTMSYKFHVLTEKDIPKDIDGWWSKLYLFEKGRFEGRCLYFDLDTILVGSIKDLAHYDGEFACISDFFYPLLMSSGVMAWEAGKADDILERWEASGRPQIGSRGDGAWVSSIKPKADRLDVLFPRQIVSFKRDCLGGIPEGAKVVAFHGLPRPHSLHDLMQNW